MFLLKDLIYSISPGWCKSHFPFEKILNKNAEEIFILIIFILTLGNDWTNHGKCHLSNSSVFIFTVIYFSKIVSDFYTA